MEYCPPAQKPGPSRVGSETTSTRPRASNDSGATPAAAPPPHRLQAIPVTSSNGSNESGAHAPNREQPVQMMLPTAVRRAASSARPPVNLNPAELANRAIERATQRSGALARVAQHAAQGGQAMTVHRFNNAANPLDLAPPIRQRNGGNTQQMNERIHEYQNTNPGYRGTLVEGHASGDPDYYSRSPFVSATTDPVAASQSRDRALSEIARDSPHLATSVIPRDDVVTPHAELSQEEGERLGIGNALEDHTVENVPNPFQDNTIRLSRITPRMAGNLGQEYDGPEGDELEHTNPLAALERRSSGQR